jgi:hypothetical protein
MSDLFDIVVPLGPQDAGRFRIGLPFNRKNVVGHRRIYVVAPQTTLEKLRELASTEVILIDEAIFPFDFDDLAEHIGPTKRRGWYLQQLIKFYAGFIIPGIATKWLVIDADTMFLKPTRFLYDGCAAFNHSVENRKEYFDHAAKLHPSLRRVNEGLSGITHHMMFDADCVQHLFILVETHHGGAPFWRVFLRSVAPEQYELAGASEYEIYFNFMAIHHPGKAVIRPLSMANLHRLDTTLNVDYVSAHSWMSHEGDPL